MKKLTEVAERWQPKPVKRAHVVFVRLSEDEMTLISAAASAAVAKVGVWARITLLRVAAESRQLPLFPEGAFVRPDKSRSEGEWQRLLSSYVPYSASSENHPARESAQKRGSSRAVSPSPAPPSPKKRCTYGRTSPGAPRPRNQPKKGR